MTPTPSVTLSQALIWTLLEVSRQDASVKMLVIDLVPFGLGDRRYVDYRLSQDGPRRVPKVDHKKRDVCNRILEVRPRPPD